jgi:hypothetical protein
MATCPHLLGNSENYRDKRAGCPATLPHRSGRAQLRHPAPRFRGFAIVIGGRYAPHVVSVTDEQVERRQTQRSELPSVASVS